MGAGEETGINYCDEVENGTNAGTKQACAQKNNLVYVWLASQHLFLSLWQLRNGALIARFQGTA